MKWRFQEVREILVSNYFNLCLFFIQLVLISHQAGAQTPETVEAVQKGQRFIQYIWEKPVVVEEYLLITSVKEKKRASRGPASAIPSDHVESMPIEDKIWLSQVWVEDNSGVMNGMAAQVQAWEQMEEYRRNWDIESTGLYNTPDRERKKAWFNRMLLRYADKRLSGELKNAEAGSTLQRVRTVKNALRPNTEAQISNNIKLKFKARVIQMRAIMRVINPWVESETTFNVRGEVNSRISKNFQDLGFRADLNYQVTEGVYSAQISKPLGNNVTAVLSSFQSHSEVAFADMDRNTVQLIYNTAF